MAKNTITDWDTTAGNNTDIGGVNIAEGCPPSGINNGMRETMAQIAGGMATGNIMGSGYLTKSGAYTVLEADRGKTIDCTAALTLTLTAAATLGAGWMLFVKANGGAVTIDPNGGETINGTTALVVGDGTSVMIICDGTNFHTSIVGGLTVVQQKFTSSGTYTPTLGMKFCIIECVGGGGGGGGAHVNSAGGFCGSGGGAAGYSRKLASASDIGASQAVTIGAAGTAGAAGDNDGGAGGNTSLGSLCVANGGAQGKGGSVLHVAAGAAGGVAGTGDIAVAGEGSVDGYYQVSGAGALLLPGSRGGNSYFGGGGRTGTANTGIFHGVAGTVPGAGGGGGNAQNGTASASGGAGHAGVVIITEFVI